jgi:hypothetical protein
MEGKSAGYCLSAIEKRKRARMCKRERERELLQEERACSEEVKRLRAKGRWLNVELGERDKDTDKQERRERIKESRYNREYEKCLTGRKSAKKRKMMMMNGI